MTEPETGASRATIPPSAPPPDPIAAAPPLLQVDNLTKLYPLPARWLRGPEFVHAVRDVSLFLRSNETLGVVGESGSGKSTLARLVLRLAEPDYGQVAFEGRLLTGLSERALSPLRCRMQPVFQNPRKAIDPLLTIIEVVEQGVAAARDPVPGASRRETAASWLRRAGLPAELHGRRPDALSEGELQRVALARALATRPRLLVLDEPVNALDVSVRAQLLNLMLDLQAELGLGYLFISHDVRVVAYMSHRLAVMFSGSIVETGPTREVASAGLHPYTRSLFDDHSLDEPGTTERLRQPDPDARASAAGCAYADRCPNQRERCRSEAPALREVVPGSGHHVACHYPLGAPQETSSDVARDAREGSSPGHATPRLNPPRVE